MYMFNESRAISTGIDMLLAKQIRTRPGHGSTPARAYPKQDADIDWYSFGRPEAPSPRHTGMHSRFVRKVPSAVEVLKCNCTLLDCDQVA